MIWAEPLFPSLVAVMVAVPGAAAVTAPLDETVATEVALVVQVTARPDRAAPPASRGVAVRVTVVPGVIGEAGAPVTVIEATAGGGGGVTGSELPPQAATKTSAARQRGCSRIE